MLIDLAFNRCRPTSPHTQEYGSRPDVGGRGARRNECRVSGAAAAAAAAADFLVVHLGARGTRTGPSRLCGRLAIIIKSALNEMHRLRFIFYQLMPLI